MDQGHGGGGGGGGSLTSSKSRFVRFCLMEKQAFLVQIKAEATLRGGEGGAALPKATHNCMDGFKGGLIAFSTWEDEQKAIEEMAADLQNKRKLFIIEYRTPVFRMFSDFDIARVSTPVKDADIEQYMVMLQSACMEFYRKAGLNDQEKKHLFKVIVCRRDPEDHGRKVGIRPFFPNLYVSADQALYIRALALAMYHNKYGSMIGEQNGWGDVYDESVFTTNGTRMIGMCKSKVCPDCKNDNLQRDRCKTCETKGKINVGRVYRVYKVINGDGTLDTNLCEQLQSNYATMLYMTSVRLAPNTPVTPGWEVFAGAPAALSAEEKRKQQLLNNKAAAGASSNSKKRKHPHHPPGDAFPEDQKNISAMRNAVEVPPDSSIYPQVEAYFQSLHDKYKRIGVRRIYQKRINNKSSMYRVYTKGMGSSFCFNINGDHKSETIRLEIYPEYSVIRCNCSCNTLERRRFGKCSEYKSRRYDVSTELTRSLFQTGSAGMGSIPFLRIQLPPDQHFHRARLLDIIQRLASDLKLHDTKRKQGKDGVGATTASTAVRERVPQDDDQYMDPEVRPPPLKRGRPTKKAAPPNERSLAH